MRKSSGTEQSPLELLRYRSNCSARITDHQFRGGNTSSKFDLTIGFRKPARARGEGAAAAICDRWGRRMRCVLDKLEQLIDRYRGEAHEDDGRYYPCARSVTTASPRRSNDAARVSAVRSRRSPPS